MASFSSGGAFRMRGRKRLGAIRGMEGKPFHPPLTDIPIAAYTIAPVLDLIAFIGRDREWSREVFLAAGWVLLAGVIVALPAAITGFADRGATDRGTELRKVVNSHALVMVTATCLVLTSLVVRFLTDLRDGPSAAVLALSVAIVVLVTVGGMIGGSLVYDHRFNVKMEPDEDTSRFRRAG